MTITDNHASRRLRWGIVGMANIALKAVLPAIQASRNGEILALSSRGFGKADAPAEQFNVPRVYGSYWEMLKDPAIEAVYIPLPNSLHREWTFEALARGKHVLCEKPLGLNADEAEAMRQAAAGSSFKLMEAFMYRFHPRMRELRRLVATGAIGEVRLVRAAFSFKMTRLPNIRLDPTLGGGAVMDVGCYGINFARYMMGQEPAEVFAFAQLGQSSGVDELLVAALRFPNGALAQVDCSFQIPRRMLAEVVGTEGRIEAPMAWLPGKAESVLHLERPDGSVETLTFPGVDQYQIMVEEFADAVLASRPVPLPPSDAVANMRVIDAVRESAREGRPIRL
ncbi:MAG: Gfo/Idh/MocA family oxidoreductase [Anaerolineae bacterium]|nr:Gfo/Idh/MocA family oxidoreductase [Anaerolineae bacterium]